MKKKLPTTTPGYRNSKKERSNTLEERATQLAKEKGIKSAKKS